MPQNKEDYTDDNRKRGLHDDRSTGSVNNDDNATSSGPGAQNAGTEDSRSLGVESTRDAERTGKTRFSGTLLNANQSAGSRAGSSAGDEGSESLRTGDTGTPGREFQPRNFKLNSLSDLGTGGAKRKFRENIVAITLLKELENNRLPASAEEQQVLARYVGWGGIPQAFDDSNPDWENEFNHLQSLLTSEEYAAARSSTLNAHYTAPEVIDGIYDGLTHLGVKDRVRILEPAAGIGHFAGKLPFASATMTLNELDPLSARISRQLYPEFTTIQNGFEQFRSPADYFDVAVGNPPFGGYRINDPLNPVASRFSIHNFFMAKSIESVRAGGVTAMVVSHYFLDSKNKEHREYIADRAHFLGAIRLPNTAFRQNALTTVTTDIVFLQKAYPGEDTNREWVETAYLRCPETNEPIELNAWLAKWPEQIIGQMKMVSGPYAPSAECIADKQLNLRAEINARFNLLPQNTFRARPVAPIAEANEQTKPLVNFENSAVKVDAFFITPDNKIAVRKPDMLGAGDYDYYETRSIAEEERIRSAIEIRDTLLELISQETSANITDSIMEQSRKKLNNLYDRHIKKYDYLSSRSNKSVLKYDPSYPLLQSLEVDYDKGVSKAVAEKEGSKVRKASAKKAAIFTRRVNRPTALATTADTAKDGLVVSLNEKGTVDIELITRLTSLERSQVLNDLKGLIFRNPVTLTYETADHFLSGNVRKKLATARQISELLKQQTSEAEAQALALMAEGSEDILGKDLHLLSEEIEASISALLKCQPDDIDPLDISVQLISAWLPEKDIKAFVQEHLGVAENECRATFVPSVGKWVTRFRGGNQDLLHNHWGTARISANDILEKLFSNTAVQVKDVTGTHDDGTPIYTVNQEETLAAQGKAEQIINEFTDWIWKNPERRERLARLYNDRFNTHTPAKYDGSHLTLPQATGSVTLRGTQKNAIWRGIQEGTCLFDHVVGAGKTLAAIATIMEQRRMGLLNKPLVVVPNHLLGQWKDEFYKLYPSANVLVAEQSDFEKDNRKRLFGHIATGDYDAVIIGHSSFKFLSLSPDDQIAFLNEQVNDIDASLKELKKTAGGRDPSVKEMEKQKKRLNEKISKITQTGRKDDLLTFDQLGVDGLFVDEADEFKNLAIVTSQSRIAGLGNLQGSEKAMDLFLKCRWLQKKRDGKGVYFLTGTPISNSLAELYTMQRYMRYDELKEKNIAAFDSWASTFGQVVTGWELDATGVNYRLNARFAKFTNVPELMRMYRSFADVVTQKDLADQALKDGTGRLVPKIRGGKPTSVIVPRSALQASFMGEMVPVIDAVTQRPMVDGSGRVIKGWTPGSIIWRMENMPKDARLDNALKVTHDARMAALDYRLIDPMASDDPGSKVNEAVGRIHNIWEANTYRRGTQLVFCDLSTPKRKFTPKEQNLPPVEEAEDNVVSMDEILGEHINPDTFSVYEDIKQKLIDKGIPEAEIRFIHDATNDQKRAELFRAMNNGDVRVLIGSTSKMGAGTNVQRRLVALHDLDCPWRPRDLEQRHGRIIRQGNSFFEADKENFEIEICCYATERTYDARMWQTIEVKARGIEQFRNGSLTDRIIEDIAGDAANAAEMKASATGNQLIFQQVKIESDKRKQETLYRNWQRSKHNLEERLRRLPHELAALESRLPLVQEDIAYLQEKRNENGLKTSAVYFQWRKAQGVKIPDNAVEQLEIYLTDRIRHAVNLFKDGSKEKVEVGMYRGMKITVGVQSNARGYITTFSAERPDARTTGIQLAKLTYTHNDVFSTTGFFTRLDNLFDDAAAEPGRIETQKVKLEKEIETVRLSLSDDYPQKAYLDALRQDAIDVMAELKRMQDDDSYNSTWQPTSEKLAPVIRLKPDEVSHDHTERTGNPLLASAEQTQADKYEITTPSQLLQEVAEPEAGDFIEKSVALHSDTETKTEKQRENQEIIKGKAKSLLNDKNVQEPKVANASVQPGQEFLTVPFKYGEIIYNTENDRLQVKFAVKPEKGSDAHRLMRLLADRGRFSYAPSQDKRWVRRLNDKSVIAAANILHVDLPLPSAITVTEDMSSILSADNSPRTPTPDALAEMELRANELFSRFNEGNCEESSLFNTLRELAEAGSSEGKYLLSFCYFDGLGVEASSRKAVELLHDAAANGHQEACYKVGELFETGDYEHVIDLHQSLHFYKQSDPAYSNQAIHRLNKKLEEESLSNKTGLQNLLDKHKDHPEASEKFYSRMHLLYERISEAQTLRDSYAAEVNFIDKDCINRISFADTVILLNNPAPQDKAKLNTYIMSCIRDAVNERKKTGLSVETIVGNFAGLTIKIRSVENEMRFTFNGKLTWTPDELIYKKGVKEKFNLQEFIGVLEEFPREIHEKLLTSEVRLQQLIEQSQAEKRKHDSLTQTTAFDKEAKEISADLIHKMPHSRSLKL